MEDHDQFGALHHFQAKITCGWTARCLYDSWLDMMACTVAPDQISVISMKDDDGRGTLAHLARPLIDIRSKHRQALINPNNPNHSAFLGSA
jgi:hypothetical protein